MAGQKSLTIDATILAKLQTNVADMKAVKDKIESQFTAGISSGLKKQVDKLKQSVEKGFQNIDIIDFSENFDTKDMQTVVKNLDAVNVALQKMVNLGRNAKFEDLDLEDSLDIQDQIKLLKQYEKEFKDFQKSLTTNYGNFSFSKDFKKKTGFSERFDYGANANILKASRSALGGEKTAQEATLRQAEQELADVTSAVAAARESYLTAKKNLEKLTKTGNNDAKQQFLNVRTNTGKGYGREEIISNYQGAISDLIQTDKGNFKKDGKEMAEIIGSWLDMSDEDIEALLSQKADAVVTSLQEKLRESLSKKGGVGAFANKVQAEGVQKLVGGEKAEEIQKQQLAFETAAASLKEMKTTQIEKEAAVQTAKTSIEETESIIAEIEAQLAKLQELQEQVANLPEYQKMKDDYENQQKYVTQRIDESRKNWEDPLKESARDAANISRGAQIDTRQYNAQLQAQERAEKEAEAAAKKSAEEAETFNKNLSDSIKRWMSAGQVVSLIKSGVRSAYNDIQSLDKTITNISVVTDMSISDLWGKIDEYMAVAQEYGVTTQGVYEVSQLFYQQGTYKNKTVKSY